MVQKKRKEKLIWIELVSRSKSRVSDRSKILKIYKIWNFLKIKKMKIFKVFKMIGGLAIHFKTLHNKNHLKEEATIDM